MHESHSSPSGGEPEANDPMADLGGHHTSPGAAEKIRQTHEHPLGTASLPTAEQRQALDGPVLPVGKAQALARALINLAQARDQNHRPTK